ncbi:MAG: arylsulfatase [Verrucomicrobia bacterium]|nr:arylsulfatase [Verrucomicrobiota bacterium]MDA1067338.1 arylsulfatase [Verrucomicrobiota bacterium]
MFIRLLLSCLTIGFLFQGCSSKKTQQRPNIVIILADDFGIGDIQAHYPDNKIATPYLDAFSAEAMRFTNAHSGSACCTPTRYGLMTGRYAWRSSLQEWVQAAYEPPLIEEGRLTLPLLLQQQGYDTGLIGKWHLGWNWAGAQPSTREEVRNVLQEKEWDYTQPIADGPTARGFDYYFGTHVPNFPPFTFIENDRVVVQPTDRYKWDPNEGTVMPQGFDGNPIAPGWQWDQILPEITKRAVQFIHEKADQDEPFFLFFSQTSPHEPVVPSANFKGKSDIAPVADFVMETDWSAGQVIQAIEDAGIADNTLVIFTADNGHSHYTGWETLLEAEHYPSGPYRGHKSQIWEGGHREPFMVRWPGKIEAGAERGQALSLVDIFATCAEILGTVLPQEAAEDSISFLSSLFDSEVEPERDHVIAHSTAGEFTLLEGPWKIVYRNESENLNASRGKPRIVELYNLEEDIAETTNVATRHPEKLKQLDERIRTLVARGTSRPGPAQANDTEVIIDVTQKQRWGPPIAKE